MKYIRVTLLLMILTFSIYNCGTNGNPKNDSVDNQNEKNEPKEISEDLPPGVKEAETFLNDSIIEITSYEPRVDSCDTAEFKTWNYPSISEISKVLKSMTWQHSYSMQYHFHRYPFDIKGTLLTKSGAKYEFYLNPGSFASIYFTDDDHFYIGLEESKMNNFFLDDRLTSEELKKLMEAEPAEDINKE